MIDRGEIYFKTLLVGYSSIPQLFVRQLRDILPSTASRVCGLVDVENRSRYCITGLEYPISDLTDIRQTCAESDIQRIIVIPHPDGWDRTMQAINPLFCLNMPVYVAAGGLPSYIVKTRLTNLVAEPYIDVNRMHLPESTMLIKRFGDVVVSSLTLLVTAVPIGILSLIVKSTSRGPAFYRQERVGRYGRRFRIIKLRTMVENAESAGDPKLSYDGDARVTSVGRFLRKYRLDELPQLFNILRGDMSLVGPRPERPYFVEQLTRLQPDYALIHRVRPGLTSLGMVRFGYASSVEQMLERLRYDLLYLENISFVTDLKILLNTANTVLRGKGV